MITRPTYLVLFSYTIGSGQGVKPASFSISRSVERHECYSRCPQSCGLRHACRHRHDRCQRQPFPDWRRFAAPYRLSPTPGAPAIAGTLTSSGLVGPFIPSGPAAIVIQLDGDWSGTVRLVRSVDGGQSISPLKIAGSDWAVYTANGVEQAWTETEAGATFYLNAEITSGTLAYRVSQ